MFLHYVINIVLVVSGFGIISTAGEQNVKESSKDIPQQASKLPRNRNSDIKYLLFTPDHPDTPCYLEPNKESLERCPFTSNHPLKIVIHGFPVKLSPDHPFFKIKDKLLKLYNFNVIILDWTKCQSSRTEAAVNTLQVGDDLAKLISFLQTAKGVDPQTIHLIGHDLGAHVSGVTGSQIPNLGRITGLDPAAAIFYPYSYLQRLKDTDANFVDIIHTSNRTIGNGIKDPIGNIDFYPNGGDSQPKCKMDEENSENQKVGDVYLEARACNHNAAILYFLYSIDTNECNFLAFKCDNYSDFLDGLCSNDSSLKNQMGLPAVPVPGPPLKPKFYLETSTSPPYCLQSKADTL